jgi:hypothetical protein
MSAAMRNIFQQSVIRSHRGCSRSRSDLQFSSPQSQSYARKFSLEKITKGMKTTRERIAIRKCLRQ